MTDVDRVDYETGLRAAVLAGNEAAWRTWYDANDAPLRRYVHWRCGGIIEFVEDIVQDVWLTAVRRIRDFRPNDGTFTAWLFGIASLTVNNQLRKNGRWALKQHALVEASVAGRDCESEDQSVQIAQALAELSPRHESVLRAKYLDGQSVNEIAESWGESPKAIESLLTRAREQFRMAFQRLRFDHG